MIAQYLVNLVLRKKQDHDILTQTMVLNNFLELFDDFSSSVHDDDLAGAYYVKCWHCITLTARFGSVTGCYALCKALFIKKSPELCQGNRS